MIAIRPVVESDAGKVSLLLTSLGYPVSEPETVSRLKKLVQSETQGSYVAVVDNEVAGLISIAFCEMLHLAKPVARIHTLIIDHAYRRQKLGKMLLQEAIDYAGKNNCGAIEVTTGIKRHEALEFYIHNGFSVTSSRLYREL